MAVRCGLQFWREQRQGANQKTLTQTELAERAGVRQDRLSRLEAGDAIATRAELEALCRELDVIPQHLYSKALIAEIYGAERVA